MEASDIGVGPNGQIFVIGTKTTDKFNYEIYERVASESWILVEGMEAVKIDVDVDGYPWVVKANGEIWRLACDCDGWKQVFGVLAVDISIGIDGAIWVLSTEVTHGGYKIYRSIDFGITW
jgi:hypothetical protein